MTGSQYESYVSFLRKHPEFLPIIIIVNKILTITGYIIYPCLLLFLIYARDPRWMKYLMVPAISFLLVSCFRKKYNRPRPYENPEIHTLTSRQKKGHSFPSRHVFSYSLISILLFGIWPVLGILMLLTCIILAWVRVILGVHFPSDVIAGGILGIICGVLTLIL